MSNKNKLDRHKLLQIDQSNIDVWLIKLADCLDQLEIFLSLLSSQEKERASKFYFEQDKQGYTIFHGVLRKILASYLSISCPEELEFFTGEHGKPFVKNNAGLSFNLSHTKQYAMIAVAKNLDCLGIDIESSARAQSFMSLAKRFFHPDEYRQLGSVPQEQQQALFFSFWTAKEAFVKAIGEGVSFGLENFSVSLLSQANGLPKITWIKSNCENNKLCETDLWQIHYLDSPKDHTACLIYKSEPRNVYYRNFLPEF